MGDRSFASSPSFQPSFSKLPPPVLEEKDELEAQQDLEGLCEETETEAKIREVLEKIEQGGGVKRVVRHRDSLKVFLHGVLEGGEFHTLRDTISERIQEAMDIKIPSMRISIHNAIFVSSSGDFKNMEKDQSFYISKETRIYEALKDINQGGGVRKVACHKDSLEIFMNGALKRGEFHTLRDTISEKIEESLGIKVPSMRISIHNAICKHRSW